MEDVEVEGNLEAIHLQLYTDDKELDHPLPSYLQSYRVECVPLPRS